MSPKGLDPGTSHIVFHSPTHWANVNLSRGILLSWIKDFITNQKQEVVLEGKHSSKIRGYIWCTPRNRVGTKNTSSTARLFADDCLLYRTINCKADAITLQKYLDTMQQWEAKWLMEFKPNKCEVITITNKRSHINYPYNIHGKELVHVQHAKYLTNTLIASPRRQMPPVPSWEEIKTVVRGK